jgi:hypothetical protein
LRDFELRHPETACERDIHLPFVGPTAGFARGAAHDEPARRTPAQADTGKGALVAGSTANE